MAEEPFAIDLPDEAATEALAADLAACLVRGDLIALSGGLGVGKTTFARAFLRAFLDRAELEVPSPTFTLVQTYTGQRFAIAHFDLYRLAGPAELNEIGFDEAFEDGAVLVEWPDRAAGRLPADRLDVTFELGQGRRQALLRAGSGWRTRLDRSLAIRRFLDEHGWHNAARRHLVGDVSSRRYERITGDGGSAVLMDWPPGDPPAAQSYHTRAARAVNVDAFIAVAGALLEAGLSAPVIRAADRTRGFLLLEDFGREGIAVDGAAVPERYRAAVEVVAAIHTAPRPRQLAIAGGGAHLLPRYDRQVISVELGLFRAHYAPFLTGRETTADLTARFASVWSPLLDLALSGEASWVLRDVHSPNLMWLPERQGVRRVGLLDLQDALFGSAAYDVVSLLQDARVTISTDLEADLKSHYVGLRTAATPDFDAEAFEAVYRILGTQRAMKILGIFARLSVEEGRDDYLAHIPRLRAYLERNLAHPVLSDLALWYEELNARVDQAGS